MPGRWGSVICPPDLQLWIFREQGYRCNIGLRLHYIFAYANVAAIVGLSLCELSLCTARAYESRRMCVHQTMHACNTELLLLHEQMDACMDGWVGGWTRDRPTEKWTDVHVFMQTDAHTHTHTHTYAETARQAGRQRPTKTDKDREAGTHTHTQTDRQAGRQASCITCIQRHRRRDRDRQTHNRHINKHSCRSRAITRTPISASVSNVSWNLRLLPYSTRRHAFCEKLLCLG